MQAASIKPNYFKKKKKKIQNCQFEFLIYTRNWGIFECQKMPLHTKANNHAAWFDNQGNPHYFFDGSNQLNLNDRQCACGASGSCQGNLLCNCDWYSHSNSHYWTKDQGKIETDSHRNNEANIKKMFGNFPQKIYLLLTREELILINFLMKTPCNYQIYFICIYVHSKLLLKIFLVHSRVTKILSKTIFT